MVDRKDARFVDSGLGLKTIREQLQVIADAVSKETGRSCVFLPVSYFHHLKQLRRKETI